MIRIVQGVRTWSNTEVNTEQPSSNDQEIHNIFLAADSPLQWGMAIGPGETVA